MAWIYRILPILSITAAGLLLALLLAASTSPIGEGYRRIDLKSQYLMNLLTALDQQIAGSADGRREYRDSIQKLAPLVTSTIEGIDVDLSNIFEPPSLLDRFRWFSVTTFNAIDPADVDLTDSTVHRNNFAELSRDGYRFAEYVQVFLANHLQFVNGYSKVSEESRHLVEELRTSGRDQLADQAFRATNQLVAYLESGDPQRHDQVQAVLESLDSVTLELTEGERVTAAGWVTGVPALVNARQTMDDALVAMELPSFNDTLQQFRAQTTVDYVYTLSMISDARVLLNVYTVLLLVVLAYFGLRLRASYIALNHSHGELEVRVQERTADLEEAYDELKESQVQLVQAEKMSSLGQLVAGVMHEINTPLMYVLNNTSVTSEVVSDLRQYVTATVPILKADCPDDITTAVRALLKHRAEFDTDAITDGVNEISSLGSDSIDGLHQISDLVQSLKDFSRLDRAAEDRFDVCEGIEKTLTITRNLLKYGIDVDKRFNEVDNIYCSPARINQIFVNLVTNAAQAMDGKGKLTIGVKQDGDWIQISFKDNGCGIPEENLTKIMDPFFTTKPVGQGTGLGLSIVRQIVEQHHGEIRVDSVVGEGTSIVLRLPIHPVQDEEAA